MQLLLIRHATSPHPSDVTSDHERPIREQGRSEARRVARHLIDTDRVPERAVNSDARRARETWDEMAAVFADEGIDVPAETIPELYGAATAQICEVAWGLPAEVERAALVGHNPGFSDAATWLSDVRVQLPCGAVAVLDCTGEDWSDALQEGACELAELIRPAALS
ncbi:MAG: histidine phosphatase family protein [Bradymonadaceae bacterium]